MWLGRELNPRHEDFQSSALPTELPSHLPMTILVLSSASGRLAEKPQLPFVGTVTAARIRTILDLRPFGQGRRFFKTKVEADAERLRQITLREKGGRDAVGLPPAELVAIIEARTALANYGKSIKDAADFYIDHLERIRRCRRVNAPFRVYARAGRRNLVGWSSSVANTSRAGALRFLVEIESPQQASSLRCAVPIC